MFILLSGDVIFRTIGTLALTKKFTATLSIAVRICYVFRRTSRLSPLSSLQHSLE